MTHARTETTLMGGPPTTGDGPQVDRFGANPLAGYARAAHPERFDACAAVASPPKMFSGGTADIPPFTASGVDPETLLKLPFGMRHAAAAEPDAGKVLAWFEEYGSDPSATIHCPALEDAQQRIQLWLETTDTDPRSAEEKEADARAEHEQLMGQWGRRGRHTLDGRTVQEVEPEPEEWQTVGSNYVRVRR